MIEEFKEVKEKDTTLMDSYAENPEKLHRLPEETQKMVIREVCIPRDEVPDDIEYPDDVSCVN